jgi:hypothetical protein
MDKIVFAMPVAPQVLPPVPTFAGFINKNVNQEQEQLPPLADVIPLSCGNDLYAPSSPVPVPSSPSDFLLAAALELGSNVSKPTESELDVDSWVASGGAVLDTSTLSSMYEQSEEEEEEEYESAGPPPSPRHSSTYQEDKAYNRPLHCEMTPNSTYDSDEGF